TLAAIRDLVAEVETEAGGTGPVGVGIPGAISPTTGLVKNANSTWLIGKPLHLDLEAVLGREVRVANDANCFALSEAVDGAAAGRSVVFGVILGTGVGGGIAVNGRVLTGPNAIAGEWGHNPMPWPEPDEWPGPPCWCGKTGCIETLLSGPAFERDGRDPERHADRLARALAMVLNLLDPDVIVLGGGLSNLDLLYEAVPARWGRWAFSDRIATPLLPPRWGDSSGVRGAAWLWEGRRIGN
ncbi:MAG TPA: ROK family protein, partial [Candidatus Polarisedimenticolaceae bacterium]